jgi:hypothetical protein
MNTWAAILYVSCNEKPVHFNYQDRGDAAP